jgi:outer membrane lipoprotein-sorting protein
MMDLSRSVALVVVAALVVMLSGCTGTAPSLGEQDTQNPTAASQPTEEVTSDSAGDRPSPTMGQIPPIDNQTASVLDDIRTKQESITSYQATITETSVTQLSNGSELTRVQKWNVSVKYTENGVLTRVESWSPNSSEAKSLRIHNATATIWYYPSEDEYHIEKETDKEIAGSPAPARVEEGRYTLLEEPFETIKQENAIQYQGTEMVNGQEAHVIYLDGNPKGGNLAYYDAQTIWVDTETGLVLKQTAQKPRLDSMQNMTVAEFRNPEANNPMNDSDDGPNAVYIGDKTITRTYTNVSVNDVPNSTFDPDIPDDGDVEVVASEDN